MNFELACLEDFNEIKAKKNLLFLTGKRVYILQQIF